MASEEARLVDSHIHLSHRYYDNCFPFLRCEGKRFVLEENGTRERLIARMKECGISFCVEPGIDLASNARLLALAERSGGFVLPAVGVHPTRTFQYGACDENGEYITKRLSWRSRAEIARLAAHPLVAAIGETGLDYHLPRNEQHRLRQALWFIWQLRLAHKRRLPLILHIREADEHTLLILRLFRKQLHGGVCHCFTGTAARAKQYTALGLKLGIGGSLLQSGQIARDLEQAVRETRLEDLLLETDGPYVKPLCPEIPAKRRKRARNTSLILPAVAERIAEIKGLSCAEVERVTAKNARELFGKDPCS